MRIFLLLLALLTMLEHPVEAGRRRSTSLREVSRTVSRSIHGTAQSRAEQLAQWDQQTASQCDHARLGSPGTYEGIGMGSDPETAKRNCCYWGQRPLREVGVAQSGSGRWYAVALYD